jgi:1,2-diacylglycerol 3-beta-glucosyltransferase
MRLRTSVVSHVRMVPSAAAVGDVLLTALAVPVLAAAAYLALLALVSARPRIPPGRRGGIRFDVVVPAHDEEDGIAGTVRSVLSVDWPAAERRVIVVADNCADATALRAEEAGALVLVRDDPTRRGKGFALTHAFARSLSDGFADAVVVVDADTVVSPNLLQAFAARLERGALAIQSDNIVANAADSWRTTLMALAFALFNTVRSLGRERLGLSTGLRGNGMCLATRLLREVPHDAHSVVEDLEYGIRVGLAGHRVHFAPEASVASVLVSGERASRSQRLRWEGGRRRMRREHAASLLRRGLSRRDPVLLDLAMDLLVPPLAMLGAAAFAGATAAALASWIAGGPLVAAWAFSAALVALAAYVARGWAVSGVGARGVGALLHAPTYLLWKLGLGRHGSPEQGWIRTARERRP